MNSDLYAELIDVIHVGVWGRKLAESVNNRPAYEILDELLKVLRRDAANYMPETEQWIGSIGPDG